MTAKTAPKTAADARRLADELAAAERDLSQRRAAADRAARIAEAKRQLEIADGELSNDRSAAASALHAAVSDVTVSVDTIPALFVAVREASARRAAAVRTAAAILDQLEPLRSPDSGQSVQHRHDIYDPLALRTLSDVLEDAVRRRASAAEAGATNDVHDAITAAGAAAAAAIK